MPRWHGSCSTYGCIHRLRKTLNREGEITEMWFTSIFIAAPVLLFLGMLILFEVGRRFARSRMKEDGEGAHAGISSIEGAVFGLLALLVGFTFFGAAGRLDDRRELIVDKANRIGTAYLRLDLLPIEAQP